MSFWCHRLDQNSNENIVRIEIFCSFLGASWKLFGLPWDLVSNIINKEAYRNPRISYENFQGRNPYNIFVAILVQTMTPKRHLEINWPLIRAQWMFFYLKPLDNIQPYVDGLSKHCFAMLFYGVRSWNNIAQFLVNPN